jgi:asparagine synthase (glutamine-hydrolysing)
MCGLAGFVGKGDFDDLEAMSRAIIHRGPDGKGQYHDPETQVFLGHRRLAIIDLEHGAQPMWNEDGHIGVVYNGEIYNHHELRRDLVARGYRFATDHSDTEVLVHGYQEWGAELPCHLNGMFAFVIYDRLTKRIFAARDRFGEKPLYYAQLPGLFLFASELQALTQHSAFQGELDRKALQKFFAYGFIPAPNAIWRNSAKLPHGHRLEFGVTDQELRISPYWRFELDPGPAKTARQEVAARDELCGLLSDAVCNRLMSDVPIGTFLSGGVDSSCVTALAQRHFSGGPIHSFTVGFNEKSYDESAHARSAARFIGSSHHERRFDLASAIDLMPEIASRLGEPFGDPSILPTYLLCRFTREYVTVALSGDGCDELFAGYDTFKALRAAELYHAVMPDFVHRGVRRLVDLLPRSERYMAFDYKLRRALVGLSLPPAAWNPAWIGPLEPDDLMDLFHEQVDTETVYEEAIALWSQSAGKPLVERTLEFYTNIYLPEDILTKTDRASMMVSLESRAPFLDNHVVEFVRKLPTNLKIRHGQQKYLFKQAVKELLPAETLTRRKQGFGIPLLRWLEQMSLNTKSLAGAKMDPLCVERMWRQHREGKRDRRLFLWCCHMLSQTPFALDHC